MVTLFYPLCGDQTGHLCPSGRKHHRSSGNGWADHGEPCRKVQGGDENLARRCTKASIAKITVRPSMTFSAHDRLT